MPPEDDETVWPASLDMLCISESLLLLDWFCLSEDEMALLLSEDLDCSVALSEESSVSSMELLSGKFSNSSEEELEEPSHAKKVSAATGSAVRII